MLWGLCCQVYKTVIYMLLHFIFFWLYFPSNEPSEDYKFHFTSLINCQLIFHFKHKTKTNENWKSKVLINLNFDNNEENFDILGWQVVDNSDFQRYWNKQEKLAGEENICVYVYPFKEDWCQMIFKELSSGFIIHLVTNFIFK